MERLSSIEGAHRALTDIRRSGAIVGFVPTMGALHEGHLSLVRASCKRADVTAVSIFVNPTQFGPEEDLDIYPRDIDRDLELLSAEGVDLVFIPSLEAMYPPGVSVSIDPGTLAEFWEGALRPGHFRGVATVVAKLFNIIGPDLAFFGEKDYQQLRVIEQMVAELDISTTIVPCSTVRDPDGLAMSSRNAYLSAEERKQALSIYEALEKVVTAVACGERDIRVIMALMIDTISPQSLAEIDYAAVVDPATLEPLAKLDREGRAIIAAQVGSTHLIDNASLA